MSQMVCNDCSAICGRQPGSNSSDLVRYHRREWHSRQLSRRSIPTDDGTSPAHLFPRVTQALRSDDSHSYRNVASWGRSTMTHHRFVVSISVSVAVLSVIVCPFRMLAQGRTAAVSGVVLDA